MSNNLLEQMSELLDFDQDEDVLEEGVSQALVRDIASTMVDNPRVRSRMKRIGMNLDNGGDLELVSAVEPAITMFIDGHGGKVSGVSAAKSAMKGAMRQQKEDVEGSDDGELSEDVETIKGGDSVVWKPGVGFWTLNYREMADQLRENCDSLRDALYILNERTAVSAGMTSDDRDKIEDAKGRIVSLY